MIILSVLNVKYEEFLFLLGESQVSSQSRLERQFSEYAKLKNMEGMKTLAEEAKHLFDIYSLDSFAHMNAMALAFSILYETNQDYDKARPLLKPIEEFLDEVVNFGYYEIFLVSQCLFLFELPMAIKLGRKVHRTLEDSYSLYKNDSHGCVILNNLAVYCLEEPKYWFASLSFSQASIHLATTANDATRSVHAHILKQIAHYKLKDDLFDKDRLIELLRVYKILGWQDRYQNNINFITNKCGINLEEV